MKKVETELAGTIHVRKPKDPGWCLSPSEEAVIVAMRAQGESVEAIAKVIERGTNTVSRYMRREDLAERIEELRLQVREPLIEDVTDILMLIHLEHKERLLNPERRANIKDKDLTAMGKAYFHMKQLMESKPTQITDARETQVLDMVVLANQTNENFEAVMRALQERRAEEEQGRAALPSGEVIEVDEYARSSAGNGQGA